MTPEEILKTNNIKYRYSGGDLVVHCFNPEHEDNNPSMRIDKLDGKFHCLSCGYSGSIYKYFNIYKNLLDLRVVNLKEKIQKLNRKNITKPLNAIVFEEDFRGISKDTFKNFEAFTLPNDKDFEGRLIFPIKDINDEIVCFQGRYLYSKLDPKYVNKPNNVSLPLFPQKPTIINNSIILVEGLFDMLNLYDKGLQNAVATFGVSLVSKSDKNNNNLKHRLSVFKMQGVNKIYIMFDGDKAGRKGASDIKDALKDSYLIDILELPDGSDPGSLSLEDVNSIKEYINVQ